LVVIESDPLLRLSKSKPKEACCLILCIVFAVLFARCG